MLIVQKYGGTSVGSIERIKNVANRIIATRRQGHQVIVVVSAMAKETDRLLDLSHQITPTPSARELDMLLASGEQVSIALLAIALNHAGQPAKSYLAHQVGILTDSFHTKAKIQGIVGAEILEEARKGTVMIVAGFQGVTESGEITTLGRGGSDITAVALAASVNADICEIYTDVDGVYTADPNIVPEACKLQHVSYEEMLEMASLGAKVLHPRAVEFAKRYQVKVHTRSSFSNEEGTILMEATDMEKTVVTGISYTKNEVKVTIQGVPDEPGVAAQLFSALMETGIDIDMIVQNISHEGLSDITFTVPESEAIRAVDATKTVANQIGAKEVLEDQGVSKVSVIGVGMRGHTGIAAKMFRTLSEEGINIEMISTSEIKISCIIRSKYTELAVRTLHKAFELEMENG
ncbi:aspartate kinase [candidate division KSB3 bacterium]|uniref:Aspartokinase n=1 Tax=candidate division KSB3 bacterium TaxID=2044937 RepID=A0A9D5JVH2_9BACT|nr:aspartate kinase [candidate division KSB3 bacterium]MBD3324889.1 aspartate kinase [candidate division KSB3 bacterium]